MQLVFGIIKTSTPVVFSVHAILIVCVCVCVCGGGEDAARRATRLAKGTFPPPLIKRQPIPFFAETESGTWLVSLGNNLIFATVEEMRMPHNLPRTVMAFMTWAKLE